MLAKNPRSTLPTAALPFTGCAFPNRKSTSSDRKARNASTFRSSTLWNNRLIQSLLSIATILSLILRLTAGLSAFAEREAWSKSAGGPGYALLFVQACRFHTQVAMDLNLLTLRAPLSFLALEPGAFIAFSTSARFAS